jgi:hypothetical protein
MTRVGDSEIEVDIRLRRRRNFGDGVDHRRRYRISEAQHLLVGQGSVEKRYPKEIAVDEARGEIRKNWIIGLHPCLDALNDVGVVKTDERFPNVVVVNGLLIEGAFEEEQQRGRSHNP